VTEAIANPTDTSAGRAVSAVEFVIGAAVVIGHNRGASRTSALDP
jgi:hypothetical protein